MIFKNIPPLIKPVKKTREQILEARLHEAEDALDRLYVMLEWDGMDAETTLDGVEQVVRAWRYGRRVRR